MGSNKKNVETGLDEIANKIVERKKGKTNNVMWTQERIEDLKEKSGKVGSLPIDLIKTNKNIRKDLNEKDQDFGNLVESIRKHGILQPPVVTVYTNEHGVHSILLVGGERRLRAAKKLGHESINCLVKQFESNQNRLTASMAENLNRKELSPIDVADCYLELNKQGYKQTELVKMFGRDRKAIGRFIKIAQWPDNIKKLIRSNPTVFNTKYLMTLASRSLSPDTLADRIQLRLNPSKQAKVRLKPISKRVDEYFAAQEFNKKEKELIVKVLHDLQILSTSSEHAPQTSPS